MNMEISVIMSVYNTRPDYLSEAIESILHQTYENFEFLIIDDGTTDKGTLAVLERYRKRDQRIRMLVNQGNAGLTKSLNKGLREAGGKYIARMDSDDIAHCRRLEKQYMYMEQNQDVDIAGCLIRKIGKAQAVMPSYYIDHTQKDYENFRIKMLFYNVGPIHPTVMIRSSFLKGNTIEYDETIKKAQDYALWSDCILAGGKIRNVPEVLLEYRLHDEQITVKDHKAQAECVKYIVRRNLKKLGFEMSDREYEMVGTLYSPEYSADPQCYIEALNKLSLLNRQARKFTIKKFENEIKIRWIHKVVKCIVKNRDFSGMFYCYTYRCFFSEAGILWLKEYALRAACMKYRLQSR